jgi:hypothetical protein
MDEHTDRTSSRGQGPIVDQHRHCVYLLQIRTGEKGVRGTDNTIYVSLRGSTGHTGCLLGVTNRANLFANHQLDTFVIVGAELGELLEMK